MALASYRSILGGVRTISISAFSDFSVGTHAAKMLATHAAIMGPLVGIVGQGGIVKSVSRIRIQAQMKLIEPTELIAGLAHGVIAQNGAGVPLGYIRRMGRQYLTNLVEMRKEKVFCLVVGTPIGHNGPATRHNAGHPLKSMGNVFAKESRMYGKIIHPCSACSTRVSR